MNDNRFASSYNYCGDLPDGIAVSHDGIISGRALECGEFHFMITVENEIDHFDEQSFSLKIMEPTNSVVKFGRGGIK